MDDSVMKFFMDNRYDIRNLFVDAAVHAFVVMIFLTIIYNAWLKPMNTKMFADVLKKQVEENMDKNPLPEEVLASINQQQLKRWIEEYDDTVPFSISFKNTMVLVCNIIVVVFVTFALFGYVARINSNKGLNNKIPIRKIVRENAVTFAMIGLLEIVFIVLVVVKYIPFEPSLFGRTFFSQF